MLNLIDECCLDGLLLRVEQSRLSYTVQREEFHQLNENLQIYLHEMKRVEDENRQIQTKIDELRGNYFSTLEQHLKRLPSDFQQESEILNQAHLERYRSKSRARRHLNEREELKKRVQFLLNQEKQQMKIINNLNKQKHRLTIESMKLNEQIQHLMNYVDKEKQTYHHSMEKVDQLYLQLEQICVERSKTEVNFREKSNLCNRDVLIVFFIEHHRREFHSFSDKEPIE